MWPSLKDGQERLRQLERLQNSYQISPGLVCCTFENKLILSCDPVICARQGYIQNGSVGHDHKNILYRHLTSEIKQTASEKENLKEKLLS